MKITFKKILPIAAIIMVMFLTTGCASMFRRTYNSWDGRIHTFMYYDGYWSQWNDTYGVTIYGSYNGFKMYNESYGPWNHFFSFQTTGSASPNGKWNVYSGTVEYFLESNYRNIRDKFKSCGQYSNNAFVRQDEFGKQNRKVVSKATIWVEKGSKPQVYNIWFDDVGFAIDLRNVNFKASIRK